MAIMMLGAPMGAGAGRRGCESGPRALRLAGIRGALAASGHPVLDRGDVTPAAPMPVSHANAALRSLPEVAASAWAIHDAVLALGAQDLPVILGGDHSVSLGTLPALSARAAARGRPLFVLWIDAHPDCHTLESTVSGNLHGLPVAHAFGAHGVHSLFPGGPAVLRAENLLMLGLRDIDGAEAAFMDRYGLTAHGPEAIRAEGAAAILGPWLDRVAAAGGTLHVSLDADALDPAIAPGVGTPVAGGLPLAQAREIMTCVAASGLLGSLELVEVNPFLDRDGLTAAAMVELAGEAVRPSNLTARISGAVR